MVIVIQSYIGAIKRETLPALLLDGLAFEENCRKIAGETNGKHIRIATKSIRSVELLKKIESSHPAYNGFMCYSAREALFLADKGLKNLLIGYPSIEQAALKRIASYKENHIICMVDSLDHVHYFEKLAKESEGLFHLCIDVDMSTRFGSFHFGVRRSPLCTPEQVLEIAKEISESEHLRLAGIMGYEAQIAGVADRAPQQFFKNKLVSYLKKKSMLEIAKRRSKIVETLIHAGFDIPLVNGGGTGSISSTCNEEVVTEVTVGSGIFSPLLFDYYQSFRYNPSLYFALPIVRRPTNNIYTCSGGGYIASGSIGKEKEPQPVHPPNGKLVPLEGAGEVQTPVYYEKSDLQIGDAILFRAAKAGEICERFNEILVIKHGKIEERYRTYRGEGVCFL